MDRAGVAIEDDIGDSLFGDQGGEGRLPTFQRTGEGDKTLILGPKGPVSCVEADTPNLCSRRDQHPAQLSEKRPVRALQE
jgi:hypothetical protein